MARRPHKLKREEYKGRIAAFTLCIAGRKVAFTDEAVFQAMVGCLQSASEKHECLFPVFCFMPDHAHVLVLPAHDGANSLDAVDKFRLQSGIWLYNHGYPKWQPGSWDDTVGDQSWRNQARHIVMNPVRAGLVEHYNEYPYLGSLTGSISDLFSEI